MFDPENPPQSLGPVASSTWNKDPKRLLFTLARYKFVAKMFAGADDVLEIGCGDAWASRIVAQHVKNLTAVDYDNRFIQAAQKNSSPRWPINLHTHDPLTEPPDDIGRFDYIYLLDVFEHIAPAEEKHFLESVKRLMHPHAALLIGIPSLESQSLIPPDRRDPGHINCKTGDELSALLKTFFNNVFIFSMNDEVVHTGHYQMAHYLFALCCSKK